MFFLYVFYGGTNLCSGMEYFLCLERESIFFRSYINGLPYMHKGIPFCPIIKSFFFFFPMSEIFMSTANLLMWNMHEEMRLCCQGFIYHVEIDWLDNVKCIY